MLMTKFKYDDVVVISSDAPDEFRPKAKAWVVAVLENRDRTPLKNLPPGVIYTVEFEDGAAIDIPESWIGDFYSIG